MDKALHVVMLPWSAFGHMMPFFQLSVALAKAGVRVSYVQTTNNIRRLPKIPQDLESLIKFVDIPLAILGDKALPEGAEATVDITFDKMPELKSAYDSLQIPFRKFVVEQSPDWLFVDVIPHWAVDIAEEQGIPISFFSAFSAGAVCFLGPPEFLVGEGHRKFRSTVEGFTSSPHWVTNTKPSKIAYSKQEAEGFLNGFYGPNGTDKTDAERIAKILIASKFVAIRSCDEFESDYIKLYAEMLNKPVIPVGLLPPERITDSVMDKSWKKIFQWLDDQKPKSVVFVGFGSECKLTREQTHELAFGIESSNVPFVWALRKPNWAFDVLDTLPQGFGDRTSGTGHVCIGWAPQMEILGHPSIGASLFHSGWGSVIETLQFGHTLVVLPFIIDQPLNAKLLVEKKLAMEVEKDKDGSFSREEVAKALKLAMVSDEGESLRERAREAAKVFGDHELHNRYITRFVEYLKNEVSKSKMVN